MRLIDADGKAKKKEIRPTVDMISETFVGFGIDDDGKLKRCLLFSGCDDCYFGGGLDCTKKKKVWLKGLETMKWIEFTVREMTEEEKEEYSESGSQFMVDGELPDDGETILVSDGYHVWEDKFWTEEGFGCWLETTDLEEGMAWMPMPKPHRMGQENE